MNSYLEPSFFNRPTLEVARDLLGKHLVSKAGQRVMVTEVEAYDGPEDLASHASKGKTPRTEVMFGPPGIFYVYLCYGMHWMLNIVTGPKGYPAAILIRGAGEFDGPAKLTKALGIDRNLNKKAAHPDSGFWFESDPLNILAANPGSPSTKQHPPVIITTPRVGVTYAGPVWSQKPYRFILKTARLD